MPIDTARPRYVLRFLWMMALFGPAACSTPPDTTTESGAESPTEQAVYVTGPPALPEGSGKLYLGREIAQMGDTPDVTEWLERPGREAEEFPSRLIQALELAPTDVVADIGAGTGYFTFRMARLVTEGKVFAVDIQPAMLEHIRNRMAEEGVVNIETVPGSFTSPNLPPASVDLALVVVSYHEFSHPREMMQSIVRSLKVGGRFVLVEYRGEDATVPVSAVRRMTEAQAVKEMRAVGLRWRETKNILPQQHFMVFEKPD
ncbi:MAG: class I SAM-dependent methyltransferase [Rhodothermales bacterium]|nr:class I SAM-dependent methyltransferase [Rhodothermales bacterium]